MGRNQTLGIPSTGYEDKIDEIDGKMLYQYFLKCIKEDEKHIYVVGDVDETIVDVFQQYLKFPENHQELSISVYF